MEALDYGDVKPQNKKISSRYDPERMNDHSASTITSYYKDRTLCKQQIPSPILIKAVFPPRKNN